METTERVFFIIGVMLAVSVLPVTAQSTGAVDPENVVRQLFLTWSDHDVSRLETLFADDGVYEDVPPQKVYRGQNEIKGFMSAIWTWAPDIAFTLNSVVQMGDTVVTEWTMHGTQTGPIGGIPASGESFSVRGASVVKFDEGKIVRHSDYYDLVTLLVHFGVRFAAPPPKEGDR